MKSILVVDDSVTNLKFVESALGDEYKLILVTSGEQAVRYLMNNTADLLLLDIMMPVMDGFETMERVRELKNGNIPVVFLTSDVDVESEIKGLQLGAVDFVRKPFVPEVMKNRINRILQLEELTKNLEAKVEEKTNQVEQLSFEIIATIASMIEAKDSYTKGHSVRVAEYSALLAEELGWDEDAIQNIRYVALLHDIGKVGIADSVLNKPGKLSESEFKTIQSHTIIGGDILKEIETIPNVDSGARYHHEKYDGSGYPIGLSGNDIPDVARIICIADAYDAMNSKRIYRDSLSKDAVREELLAGRGTQFDPDYLDAFIKIYDDDRLGISSMVSLVSGGVDSTMRYRLMASIAEETKKTEETDPLTKLLNRKSGESKIIMAMRDSGGYLAFIDLDNLKRTNDTMGHVAGDYALATLGKILSNRENEIATRLGGDEFMCFFINAGEESVTARIKEILREFDAEKEKNAYLSASSLSIGVCKATPQDRYADILQNADKALYNVKQGGKNGYCFYSEDMNKTELKSDEDFERQVNNLKLQCEHKGAMNVEYREFIRIYDLISNLVRRYNYKMQLFMITLIEKDDVELEEHEKIMACVENAVKGAMRAVDVSVRFSGNQMLVIIINAEKEDFIIIKNRIKAVFMNLYESNNVELRFQLADVNNM
ncbi:MAG: diguanylate cyclase [Lachnospiraceae bacterium]|nr:diguanylate cyclase [Lachnospiraceae bacterium]